MFEMADQDEQLQHISAQIGELSTVVSAYGPRIDKIEGWLMGTFSAAGAPVPGLLTTVAQLAGLRTWIIGLGSTTAAGVLLNAAISFFHYAGVLGKNP